jgi:predicted nucleic-acid-binding Zn-ribbon protein
MSSNPISAFHGFRRYVFATYEKHGFDAALDVVKKSKALPNVKAGLNGELLFYDKYFDELKPEPLLDAGVKADFAGIRKGRMINFDVTTNLDYKNIDNYVEVIQKRKKPYEIVQVDLKSQEIEFFPLRFPICPKCGKFSHFVLYVAPPTSEFYRINDISDGQVVIQICGKCGYFKERTALSFEIELTGPMLDEMAAEKDVISARYTTTELRDYQNRNSISTIKFFEKNTELLISGLAENYYVITDPGEADGYWDGKLYWKHPLAKDLSEYLNIYYGPWEPSKSDVLELLTDEKCRICQTVPMRYNHEKHTLTCPKCHAVYDVSNAIESVGYELKRTVRK